MVSVCIPVFTVKCEGKWRSEEEYEDCQQTDKFLQIHKRYYGVFREVERVTRDMMF